MFGFYTDSTVKSVHFEMSSWCYFFQLGLKFVKIQIPGLRIREIVWWVL